MTDHCDNEVALPKLKYPIHQYKVIDSKRSFGGGYKVILSRDLRQRTKEVFIYPTQDEALRVERGFVKLRRSMRALLSTHED